MKSERLFFKVGVKSGFSVSFFKSTMMRTILSFLEFCLVLHASSIRYSEILSTESNSLKSFWMSFIVATVASGLMTCNKK